MSADESNGSPDPQEEGSEARAESPAGPSALSDSPAGSDTSASSATPPAAALPDDLRTPWSWGYLAVFLAFAFASLLALDIAFVVFSMVALHATPAELQKLATSNARYVTARQALWFAALMLYLFAVVRFLHGAPFWRTIGWKQWRPRSLSPGGAGLACLLGGAVLAIVVSMAAKLIGTNVKLPIEALFQDRQGVLLVMALAVLAAPLVEETIFRGYIYPVLARTLGVPAGVLLTGALFGALHAMQLWGAWGLIALLVLVGVVLSYVRARTGTVLASYLLHLGYNAMLFLGTAVSTNGFRHFPPGP
jgi:CAAX protease family protein